MEALRVASAVVGWLYVVVWSVSFYPQIWLNWRRKSVVGMSFDYLTYNAIGFTCYTIFNCVLFFSPYIQSLYHAQYGADAPIPAAVNDVVFALHGITCVAIIALQTAVYDRGVQRVSWPCRIIALAAALSVLINIILGAVPSANVSWLWVIQWFGYVKAAMSFVKYAPQAFMNCRRRSTRGWSIGQILLDIAGSVLSFGQMVIDSVDAGNWSSFTGNIPKLGLSVESFLFDVLFIVQHYCLFRKNNALAEQVERQALLAKSAAAATDEVVFVDVHGSEPRFDDGGDVRAPPAGSVNDERAGGARPSASYGATRP